MPAETRATYHHGALREELISASVSLIEAEGIGAVSLRRVAREAGVSPGAPYHHFADRAALFAAVIVRGSALLESELRQARAQATSGVEALGAFVRTYVRFAREHPGYVHLMLRPELSHPDRHPDAAHAGEGSIDLLTAAVVDCQREGTAPPGDPMPAVGLVWALAVGIVTLWLDGPLQERCVDVGTTPEVLTAQITALLTGLMSGSAGRA
ncbi:TetR/AcrR family transcriptional regulator [Pseudonocardia pini]|uniref:TetR/AcrR family transcriptional regulator n=1 Tax=Pseudonocardia pini TaxID=2758030 RepID=UPI0015F0B931|nr:TetR/AcrR family transcriptional regulator [Pseudonocardia pini]